MTEKATENETETDEVGATEKGNVDEYTEQVTPVSTQKGRSHHENMTIMPKNGRNGRSLKTDEFGQLEKLKEAKPKPKAEVNQRAKFPHQAKEALPQREKAVGTKGKVPHRVHPLLRNLQHQSPPRKGKNANCLKTGKRETVDIAGSMANHTNMTSGLAKKGRTGYMETQGTKLSTQSQDGTWLPERGDPPNHAPKAKQLPRVGAAPLPPIGASGFYGSRP